MSTDAEWMESVLQDAEVRRARPECEALAQQILDRLKVKHPRIFRELSDYIARTGFAPVIRVFWDSRAEDLKWEVLKDA